VVGLCRRCHYDLTGEDDSLKPAGTTAHMAPEASEGLSNGEEAMIVGLCALFALFALLCALRLWPRG